MITRHSALGAGKLSGQSFPAWPEFPITQEMITRHSALGAGKLSGHSFPAWPEFSTHQEMITRHSALGARATLLPWQAGRAGDSFSLEK